jgi:hypothetical protein
MEIESTTILHATHALNILTPAEVANIHLKLGKNRLELLIRISVAKKEKKE